MIRILLLSFFGLGLACSLRAQPTAVGQPPPNQNRLEVPIKHYAVIDISGSFSEDIDVDQIAVGDDGQIAFSYWDGETNLMIGIWKDGALVEAPKKTGSYLKFRPPAHTQPSDVPFLKSGSGFAINSRGSVAVGVGAFWNYGDATPITVSAMDDATYLTSGAQHLSDDNLTFYRIESSYATVEAPAYFKWTDVIQFNDNSVGTEVDTTFSRDGKVMAMSNFAGDEPGVWNTKLLYSEDGASNSWSTIRSEPESFPNGQQFNYVMGTLDKDGQFIFLDSVHSKLFYRSGGVSEVSDLLTQDYQKQIRGLRPGNCFDDGTAVLYGENLEGDPPGQWVSRTFVIDRNEAAKVNGKWPIGVAQISPQWIVDIAIPGLSKVSANKHGLIAAIGYKALDDNGAPIPSNPWHKHAVALVPIEQAPDVLKVNSNFDEKKIDAATAFAKPDNSDDDLKAERGDKAGKVIIDDLYKGFWGVNPNTLPSDFYSGATVTIKKKLETNDETGQPEEGTIRLYAVKNLGQSGEQAYAIPISNGAKPTISSDDPANLATTLYGTSSTIPKGDGVTYYIEGVNPGPITLEFKYVKGSSTFACEQKFEVYTKQSKTKWLEEIWQQILLETSNTVDLNSYSTASSFMANKPYLQRIYLYYEELFRQNPTVFYWAGLAKLAGGPAYAALSDSEWARTVPPPWIPGSSIPYGGAGAIVIGTAIDFLQEQLMVGNRAIYDDLGWQFRAYRASSIWALRYVSDNALDSPSAIPFDIVPWNQIYMGDATTNAALIKAGSLKLTEREQRDIVQPAWSALGTVPTISPAVNWVLSILAKNPLSGAPDFLEVVPGGNITVFTSRWDWIDGGSDTIWTMWTGYSDSARMARTLINLKSRTEEYSWYYWDNASLYPVKW